MPHLHRPAAAALLLLCAASCVNPRMHQWPGDPQPIPQSSVDLEVGQVMATGMVGVGFYDQVERSGGTTPPVGPQPDSLESQLVLGGMYQETLGDGWLDWGLEGGGAWGYRTSNGLVDPGTGPVEVDVDLSLFDLHGGLFLSRGLGHRARVFAGAGPVAQFANWWQEGNDAGTMTDLDQHGSGVGLGYYARAGLDLQTSTDLLLGVSVRWLDSEVSLDDGLGTLEVRGLQVLLTFSRSY